MQIYGNFKTYKHTQLSDVDKYVYIMLYIHLYVQTNYTEDSLHRGSSTFTYYCEWKWNQLYSNKCSKFDLE